MMLLRLCSSEITCDSFCKSEFWKDTSDVVEWVGCVCSPMTLKWYPCREHATCRGGKWIIIIEERMFSNLMKGWVYSMKLYSCIKSCKWITFCKHFKLNRLMPDAFLDLISRMNFFGNYLKKIEFQYTELFLFKRNAMLCFCWETRDCTVLVTSFSGI